MQASKGGLQPSNPPLNTHRWGHLLRRHSCCRDGYIYEAQTNGGCTSVASLHRLDCQGQHSGCLSRCCRLLHDPSCRWDMPMCVAVGARRAEQKLLQKACHPAGANGSLRRCEGWGLLGAESPTPLGASVCTQRSIDAACVACAGGRPRCLCQLLFAWIRKETPFGGVASGGS